MTKPKKKSYWTHWFRCSQMEGGLVLDNHGRILDASAVFSKFKGQPLSNLRRWVEGEGWEPVECIPF